jgi:hypothetical protein
VVPDSAPLAELFPFLFFSMAKSKNHLTISITVSQIDLRDGLEEGKRDEQALGG